MEKIITIIHKEWSEVFKNRIVLFTVAFLPLILAILPLVSLGFMSGADESDMNGTTPDAFFGDLCIGLTEIECAQVYTLDLFTLMFMIIPVAIPTTIAAYSIVGEKTARSLEPLLATPITTIELLVAKAAAAVLPAIAATWLAYLIYIVGVAILLPQFVSRLFDVTWLLAIFGVGPLLTLTAVCAGIIASSRVSDPRAAEQISALVILPLIMLIVGQSTGLLLFDRQLVVLLAAVVLVIDIILGYITIKQFQREVILTRWK